MEAQLENLVIDDKKSSKTAQDLLTGIDGTAHVEKLPHKIEKAAFYVIKSYSEEDIVKVTKRKIKK